MGLPTVRDAMAAGHALRPRLRGWLHQIAFVCAVPAAIVLIGLARGGTAKTAAIIYGVGVIALYGVSSTYHRVHWSAAAHRWMKRLDHGTIFVMIAASYTPICLLLLRGPTGIGLLIGVWIAAATGLILALVGIAERPYVGFTCYLAMGWLALLGAPELIRRATPVELTLLVTGGLVYTFGAVVLGKRWPDPFPRTFGYHEIWHAMVVAGTGCHYIVILTLLRTG
jgi:hemolysin III